MSQGSHLRSIVFRRGRWVKDLIVLSFGDAGFGNATRGRSQFGLVIALVTDVHRYNHGDYGVGSIIFGTAAS